jgi:hypothetical protein
MGTLEEPSAQHRRAFIDAVRRFYAEERFVDVEQGIVIRENGKLRLKTKVPVDENLGKKIIDLQAKPLYIFILNNELFYPTKHRREKMKKVTQWEKPNLGVITEKTACSSRNGGAQHYMGPIPAPYKGGAQYYMGPLPPAYNGGAQHYMGPLPSFPRRNG